MSPDITVGIVGLGIIAETHLTVLAEWPQVTLSFVVDPDPDASATFNGRSPPRFDTPVEALRDHDPDLVVIATPTGTHIDIAADVLTASTARVLVEKPLAHNIAALAKLEELEPEADLRSRLFVAHHFAFAPEVQWAAEQLAQHPEWGPATRATCAFHDPYILRSEQAFASYMSSRMDSGSNQLSMLSRFVELTDLDSSDEYDGGATSWSTVGFHSGGTPGTARLFTSWQTGASSKRTTLELGQSGTEIWLDHTAMTAFAVRGGQLLATHVNDGLTPRKIAHYRPLYQSLLSDTPDPIMGIDVATKVIELLSAGAVPEDPRGGTR
jgi:predicted dehydrogenase